MATRDTEARVRLKKTLAAAFKNASGVGRIEHGVDQWELLADTLIDAVIEIINDERPA